MSALFLKKLAGTPSTPVEGDEPDRSLVRQGFSLRRSVVLGNWNVQAFDNPRGRSNLHFHESGRITAIALGPIWHDRRFGSDALLALADRLREQGPLALAPTSTFNALSGAFALIVSDGQTVQVMTDRLGTIKLFRDEPLQTLSTSLLSVAEVQPRLNLNRQAAREYILIEASHSQETPFRQITALGPGDRLDIDNGTTEQVWRPIREEIAAPYQSLGQALDEVEGDLLEQFQRIASAFGTASVALSGGFDSRLVYALCERSHLPASLFVYGPVESSDVHIATQIAAAEGVSIRAIDKQIQGERFGPHTRESMHEAIDFFDGTPIDGALDRGIDRSTRIEQGQYGGGVLNGGGGEIFRNFFHLSDRPYSFNEVCQAFYSQFPREVFIGKSDHDEFYDRLQCAMKMAIAHDSTQASRMDVELIYPLFRCRWWMNRNNSIANRLSPFMTPLVTPSLIEKAARIPVPWKNSGRFQAALINRISPRLARYPSSYGFAFSEGPGLKSRIDELSDALRTPALRPWLAELGRKVRRSSQQNNDKNYFQLMGIKSPPLVSQILNTDSLSGSGDSARAVTLELLMSRLPINS
jgi:hypothetical protein